MDGAIMGTTYAVRVVSDAVDAAAVASLHAAVHATLAGIDEKMSTYRPDSELSQFNASR